MPQVTDHNRRKKTRTVWVIIAVVAALAIMSAVFAILQHNMSEQKSLQAELANPGSTNYQQTATAATQLINGKKSGQYRFSDKLLAQYYMQGATAYFNLKQYSKAIPYYQAAPKYDSTMEFAALQGEVEAGYASGERTQLIPMLQKLETLSATIHDSTTPGPVRYKNDIYTIQHNQPAVDL